jgi:hypothetical protein
MLELKLPASKSASRHGAKAQGRSIGSERRIVMPEGREPSRHGAPAHYAARPAVSPRDAARTAALPHEAARTAALPHEAGRTFAPARERVSYGRPASSALPRIRTVAPAHREAGRLRGTRRAASYDDRLARSETRLVGAAVACTSLFCFLLVVYLAAYANVTSLGIQQAQAAKALRSAQQQNEILRAELAAARSPEHIVASAQLQGMVLASGRACYVTPRNEAPAAQTSRRYQVASDGTDISDSTANFGH